jgi:hypothetical protein
MKLRQKFLVSGLVATGVIMGGATAAQAWPTGCRYELTTNVAAHAYCTGGTGHYQASVYCTDNRLHQGPWVTARHDSVVYCPSGYTAKFAGINTKNS